MKAGLLGSVSVALAMAWPSSPPSVQFEPQPRVVAEGRDPVISVRASGALSLMKVLKGDLWVQTSFDGGDSFEPPVRVNDVAGEVSSHGESSPLMQIRTRSEFYVVWQTRRGEGSALRFARSMNWGESFTKAVDVDPSGSSQAFFTMNVSPKGEVYIAWLDGRDRGKGRMGTSAVYVTWSKDKGQSFEKPVRVSLDVCPCCRPSIGFGGDGAVYLSWRGVLENNVRDIFVAASQDGGASWGPGMRVAEDNWVLNGCPHSGAALASIGKRLFIAWHAVRDKKVTLSLAYSDDGAKTFSRRVMLAEDVLDANHPYMSLVGGKLGIVFQGRPPATQQGWAPISVYYREADAEARLSPLQRVGQANGSASYPVFTYEEPERLFLVWTEPDKENKVVVLARGRRSDSGVAGGGSGGR